MKYESVKYKMITDYFRDRILSGELKAGEKLPSINQIRAQFEVSYGSVRGAMLVLKAQGLVVGRQGEGVYVALGVLEPRPVTQRRPASSPDRVEARRG